MEVQLEDKLVGLSHLYLDPNNPRFADLGARPRVSEAKVVDDVQQNQALSTLLNDERFEVRELKESIRQIGFLRMDRMVVIELPAKNAYMVVEGNRRLASLKSLYQDQEAGEIDLPADVLASITEIPVLVIKGPDKARIEFARTLQGIRHIAGIKPWGPYQQAQAVGQMLNEGMALTGIKSVLGVSVQRANLLRRVYLSMEQMQEDAEFGTYAKPQLFSNFVEGLKLPAFREWAGWSDEEGKFMQEDRRRQFYSWAAGMVDDEGQRRDPKIEDAKDLRELPRVMEDHEVFNKFLTDPELKLRTAAEMIAPPPPQIDWRRDIKRCVEAAHNVPHVEIASASDADVAMLEELRSAVEQLLKDIEVLQSASVSAP